MSYNFTEENGTSLETEECGSPTVVTFQYYVWGVVGTSVSCFGIVGNILAIIVLSHKQMRNSTSYYLISLAMYDMTLLLFMTLFLALPTIYLEKDVLEGYYFAYRYMHPFVYPLALIAQTGTVYTTLAFTVERYIAVCKPLHAANMCTMSRTKKVIIIIFFASIIYNIPRFLEYKTTTHWDDYYNRTIPMIEYTNIGSNKVFQEVYFIYAYLCIMFLLPFSLLLVLNILLIRAVRKARAKRNNMSSATMNDTNLTMMLIVVINIFLGTQLPALIDNIVFAIFDKNILQCSVHWVKYTTVSNLLVVLNSAINFIVYCLLSKRFRRVFLKIFQMRDNKPKYTYTVRQSSVIRNGNIRVFQGNRTNVFDVSTSLIKSHK